MQLPILEIIIPIIAALCCFLTNQHRISWSIAVVTTTSTLIISSMLLIKTYAGEVIVYHLGNWLPPHGIELRVDLLNSLILTLVNFIALISLLYGFDLNEKEISNKRISSFYSLFLLCLSGLLGILVTNDIFNLYVFLEISSLSAYVLVAMGKDKRALIAAFEYLISGTIGATFYLFGVGLLYSMTGTLNIGDLADKISLLHDHKIIHLGTLFILIGLTIKMALFPFYRWMINAYHYSPSFVSVFFSGSVTKVMIYVFIRLSDNLNFFSKPLFVNMIFVLALSAIIFGSIYAITSHDIKRVLAYSSVSQIGLIILLLILNAKAAAIVQLINHSIIKTSLFMVAGSMSSCKGRCPYVTSALIVSSLALVGIPCTNGFISKWYMIQALIQSQAWISLTVCVLGSFLALIYMLQIVEKIYFSNSQQMYSNFAMLLCLLCMIGLIVSMGLYSKPMQLISEKLV